jgi:hypothetical protein
MNLGEVTERARTFDRRQNKKLNLFHLEEAISMIADLMFHDRECAVFMHEWGRKRASRDKRKDRDRELRLLRKVKPDHVVIRLRDNDKLTPEQGALVLKGWASVVRE